MSPLYDNLKCAQCNCTEAMLWKSIGDKQHLCNDCFEQTKNNTKSENDGKHRSDDRRSKLRKSTRSTRYNGKNGNGPANGNANSNTNKSSNTKSSGRGRRSLFRRPPMKAPSIPATTQHVQSLFYKVCYFQSNTMILFTPSVQLSVASNRLSNTLSNINSFAGFLYPNRRHCITMQLRLRCFLRASSRLDD